MNADKEKIVLWFSSKRFLRLSAFICVNLWLILLTSCATKPSEMRSLVPAESLVYLETNDLAAAIQPIIDSKPFTEAAKKKPDLSVLKGVQMAVAVLGFEATEEKLTDEQSVGSVKPRFVAIVDTHAWNYQAVAFAESKLGQFVTDLYGTDVAQDRVDSENGVNLTWTSADGRKSYALVSESLVYFANDETAIQKCLAVKRGESDSIIKNDKIKPIEPGTLARGYVTTDGIAQISSVIGMKLASEASDESEIQSAIAGILPKLIRGTVTDVTWTMTKGDQGIEDKYLLTMPAEVANVLNETMAPNGDFPASLLSKLRSPSAATRYSLKSPQLAFGSLLQVIRKDADPITAKILTELSMVAFEPYGIRDIDKFLSAVGSNIVTGQFGPDGDFPFVVATIKDATKVKESILPSLKQTTPTVWKDEENDVSALIREDRIIIGSTRAVSTLIDFGKDSDVTYETFSKLLGEAVAIKSVGHDATAADSVLGLFSDSDSERSGRITTFAVTTRFTASGLERRTVSDIGLIGQIIAQLAEN